MLDSTIEELDSLVQYALEQDEWDQMPMLVVTQGVGPRLIVGLAGDFREGLTTVAPMLLKQTEAPVTGLILYTEGWGLGSNNPEELEAITGELRRTGRRFADHPSAIEIKVFTAIDREGVITRQIHRGNPEVKTFTEGLEGRVPDQLKTLFKEVTGL